MRIGKTPWGISADWTWREQKSFFIAWTVLVKYWYQLGPRYEIFMDENNEIDTRIIYSELFLPLNLAFIIIVIMHQLRFQNKYAFFIILINQYVCYIFAGTYEKCKHKSITLISTTKQHKIVKINHDFATCSKILSKSFYVSVNNE